MANTISAAKRARQNIKRRARNAAVKSRLRTLHKKFLKSLDKKSENKDKQEEFFKAAVMEWDRAYSKGVVKRNTASRSISRLHKHFANRSA